MVGTDTKARLDQHDYIVSMRPSMISTARATPPFRGKCHTDGIVYVMAGNGGAGFTHSFPLVLPGFVEFGLQNQNGYVRVTTARDEMLVEAVSTDDGHVFDATRLKLRSTPTRANGLHSITDLFLKFFS